MTKKFDVIPVEGYAVVVDKEAIINNATDAVVCHAGQDWFYKAGTFHKDKKLNEDPDYWKVIATIGKRIEELPLIELPDELPSLDEASDFFDKEPDSISDRDSYFAGYKKGYKAAQSKGVYSEKDMREAIRLARENNYQQDHYNMRTYSSEKYTSDQILNSLQKNKLPVAVEIKCDYSGKCMEERCLTHPCDGKCLVLKITNPETNTIKPVNIFYE